MHPEAYDIAVTVVDPWRAPAKALIAGNPALLREISILDDKFSALTETMELVKLRIEFMESFVSDPVAFIDKWVSSQASDLQVFSSDVGCVGRYAV